MKYRVVDPRVVKTVSKVRVSVEKASLSDGLVVILSFLQEEKMSTERQRQVTTEIKRRMVVMNGKDHFLLRLVMLPHIEGVYDKLNIDYWVLNIGFKLTNIQHSIFNIQWSLHCRQQSNHFLTN